MMHSDYLPAGIAALLVALLFPIYWIFEIGYTFTTGEMRTELGLLDVLYFVVGLLAAFVYLSLKRFLNDRCAYTQTDVLLLVLAGFCVASYTGIWLAGYFEWEVAFTVAWIGSLVAMGGMDLLLGVWLLRSRDDLPPGIRTFAMLNIVLGVFELTVIGSIAAIILYPICAIVLAISFLREPEELQIV